MWNPEKRKRCKRPQLRWKYNIKMCFGEQDRQCQLNLSSSVEKPVTDCFGRGYVGDFFDG
jgi:hypothetical protein